MLWIIQRKCDQVAPVSLGAQGMIWGKLPNMPHKILAILLNPIFF